MNKTKFPRRFLFQSCIFNQIQGNLLKYPEDKENLLSTGWSKISGYHFYSEKKMKLLSPYAEYHVPMFYSIPVYFKEFSQIYM